MADALPLTDHIAITSPVIASTARVERFQTDSYSVRAMIGINGIDQKATIQWIGLTAAESRTVSNFLNAHALELIAYTPDPFTTERYWTCTSHSVEPIGQNTGRTSYTITAELQREYDPLS